MSALRYNNEMVGSMEASCNAKITVLLFSLNDFFSYSHSPPVCGDCSRLKASVLWSSRQE